MPPDAVTDAFIARFVVAPTASGSLDGLTVAVKDLIDVAGHRTGCGNPRWRETHPPAVAHAVAVEVLLAAGARVVGKTITDELAFSIVGENAHYGTPLNPAAPERVPGGSSSGSASAVARGECDLGLGTDTTGSVRIPAANCGLAGMRPTHGRVSLGGVMAMAPGFDTVGVLARDVATLARAMTVLAGLEDASGARPSVVLPREAWALVEPAVADVCRTWLAARLSAVDVGLASLVGSDGGDPATWHATHSQLQWAEMSACLGPWIAAERPAFGELIAANFRLLEQVDRARLGERVRLRERLAARLASALGDTRLLCFPTTAAPAPLRGHAFAERTKDTYLRPTLALQTFATLGRCPQVTVPAGVVDGAPVGISFLAAPGEDARLLRFVGGVVRD